MDVAILDDYQAVAEQMADWSQLPSGINYSFSMTISQMKTNWWSG